MQNLHVLAVMYNSLIKWELKGGFLYKIVIAMYNNIFKFPRSMHLGFSSTSDFISIFFYYIFILLRHFNC